MVLAGEAGLLGQRLAGRCAFVQASTLSRHHHFAHRQPLSVQLLNPVFLAYPACCQPLHPPTHCTLPHSRTAGLIDDRDCLLVNPADVTLSPGSSLVVVGPSKKALQRALKKPYRVRAVGWECGQRVCRVMRQSGVLWLWVPPRQA